LSATIGFVNPFGRGWKLLKLARRPTRSRNELSTAVGAPAFEDCPGGVTIGRATYQPGWKWSVHVGPGVGAERCAVEHVGLVLAGTATAAFDDGTIVELRAGALFHIPARPHDSWVVGAEPYVSLHFLGAERYAK
jgi:hypothetical protein